jgi:hypothetical protein
MFSEYDVATLRHAKSGFQAAGIGAIVTVYDSDPPGYEVEFTDRSGAAFALLTLRDDDLEVALLGDRQNTGPDGSA